MTVVRTQIPPESIELTESRMLQQGDNSVKIIFGVHQGLKAAYFIKAAWGMLVAGIFIALSF